MLLSPKSGSAGKGEKQTPHLKERSIKCGHVPQNFKKERTASWFSQVVGFQNDKKGYFLVEKLKKNEALN